MIKVLIQIKNNKLLFQIRRRLNSDQKSLINTNIISENELVFSDEYIVSNLKLVNTFIKELVKNNNLDTIIIRESKIAPLILKMVENIPQIKSLYLLEETILNYKICERIIKANNIKYVSLYNLPTYLLEMLDEKNIQVNSRNEILFLSNFMKNNNLETFSSIYYKTSINIELPFSKEDEEDFISFININKYLKIIYINKLNKNDLENILEILNKHKIKNIKIYIKENIQDIELIEYLKKINKKNQKTNNIQFKIHYSDKYLEDNLFNQISLNTIKLCIYITLIFISAVVVFVFYSNYTSMQKVEDIQDDINSVIADYNEDANNDNSTDNSEVTDNNEIIDNNEPENNDNNNYINEDKPITNDKIASLKQMNEDTVGWLKVNNTNIDYPVVQANDNEYYLTNNFKKQKDNSGWIFMDYRANSKDLSDNTIIFGHNMYYSGVMFGTLYKTKYANWYKNEQNQIIEFDTLYGEMNWKIFSIYVTELTNDYLIADFSSNDKFQEFINLITNRSIYEFNTPVSTSDKILTLSTCSDNGKKRLVIHAVLLSDN